VLSTGWIENSRGKVQGARVMALKKFVWLVMQGFAAKYMAVRGAILGLFSGKVCSYNLFSLFLCMYFLFWKVRLIWCFLGLSNAYALLTDKV
jgi:hypothetical protein